MYRWIWVWFLRGTFWRLVGPETFWGEGIVFWVQRHLPWSWANRCWFLRTWGTLLEELCASLWDRRWWWRTSYHPLVYIYDDVDTFSHPVDLLVDFGSMVVTQLTCSSHRETYVSWMPSSDAPDSSPTSMGLLLKMFDTVPLHDTGYSLTLGDSNDINLFVLFEHLVHRDLLLQ